METVDTLFGPWPTKRKRLRFKVIRPVYETLKVSEMSQEYADRRFTDPRQISDVFDFLRRESKEYFFTAHLDGKNRITCLDCVSVGSLNQSIVHPREVFKTALLSSAAAIILVHNHPTGDPSPSSEDISITKRLKEAGEIMGIRIIDHIIIGVDYLSFVERGLM